MPFRNPFRATTHNDHGAHSGGVSSHALPDPTQHGTNPERTRREIAKAEAQDAKLFACIQFNEESA